MDALVIDARTEAQRRRVAAISLAIRDLPPWKRGGSAYEQMLAERSQLLQEVDRLSRPAPRPKSVDKDRTGDKKLVQLLAEESAAERKSDKARAKAKARAEAKI